jgi:amino acid adenylation domain-containing protein
LNLHSMDNKCPLFDIALVLTEIHSGLPKVKNDITIFFSRHIEKLHGNVMFNRSLFRAETMHHFIKQFMTLLHYVLQDTNSLLDNLQILTESDQRQLLVTWNDTKAAYAQGYYIHQLFEAQVERTPDAAAVVMGHDTLSYRALNQRANQLARALQALGVGPEVRVGICVNRSLEMVVGLLGILKAGGAYVPLDPAYPQARLAFMLEDAQVAVLVTQQQLLGMLPQHSVPTLCVDRDWATIAQERADHVSSGVTADNLAYAIYTSGSTGQPKGVLVAHRGLCNLAEVQMRTFGVTPDDRVLQFASLSFDAATFEIIMALCVGATLCLAPLEALVPGPPLLELLRRLAITLVTLPPTALAALPDADLSSLRLLMVAGEACTAALVERWAVRRRFYNLYGPTEATIWSTEADCRAGGPLPTIGRPIANTQVYILDKQLQPAPIGIPGQLYIGGLGLARGYLKRGALTAERFIPNPYSDQPGARLYKTGDLTCYHPDGNIEFLGRLDHQVKLRGFRIEVGEIEAILRQHPDVKETVVVTWEKQPGDIRLVAYVLPNQKLSILQEENHHTTDTGICEDANQQGDETSHPTHSANHRMLRLETLRPFLETKLPDYMIPADFIVLEQLPLTPNGKLDRSALLPPDQAHPVLESNYVAPRTPDEAVLAEIWAEVLGVQPIGIHDKFFSLGGHSMLATQVISNIRDKLSIELPVRSMFESPTIAELTHHINRVRQEHQGQLVSSIKAAPRDKTLPLTFAQEHLRFRDQQVDGRAIYNRSLALQLAGELHVEVLKRAVTEIIRRHEILRTSFPLEKGSAVQKITTNLAIALPVVDLQSLSNEQVSDEVHRLSANESQRPFDLLHGPLIRLNLLRLEDTSHVLLVTMHDIVTDVWSMRVFMQELVTLYNAFLSGQPSPLPELPIQYGDFAAWQHQQLPSEVLATELQYWTKQLAGAPLLLQLPTDRPRPARQRYHGHCQPFQIKPELAERLKFLSQQAEGTTLFMTLHAAFVTILYHYSGQQDILVGVPVANRDHNEFEPLIGHFVNSLVLRTRLQGNLSFSELLRQVQQVNVEAYAHQALPFEKLVEALHPNPNVNYSPIIQVLFTFQNAWIEGLEFTGLQVAPLEQESITARLDLILAMKESELGLSGMLVYKTDLFDPDTIRNMVEDFQHLLEGIAVNSEQQISALCK